MSRLASIENPLSWRNRIHPQRFALYISFASIIMMFTSLTSAYIVRSAAGEWLEFGLPGHFFLSTIVLLVSSVTLHGSYYSFNRNREGLYKGLLIMSFLLGIAFVTLQYYGWTTLFERGVDFKANVSGTFLYLITGLHALHIIGGIAAIVVAMLHAFTLPFVVTQKRKNRFQLVVHYWHFVDFLWIYLLVFLLFVK